jgi:hypothetical protein
MWFGREGRHGVCMVVNSCCVFQTMTPNAYIFMSLFHKQFIYNYLCKKKKQEEKEKKKKTIKKLVNYSLG